MLLGLVRGQVADKLDLTTTRPDSPIDASGPAVGVKVAGQVGAQLLGHRRHLVDRLLSGPEQGRQEEGIAQIREGLAASRATGAELWRPHLFCLLAEACRKTSRLDAALSALTEALAAADEHENRHYEAEMHRLKGELLLEQDEASATEAERCFRTAVEVARRQSAKSLELRATVSLARLLDKQDRRDEARAMLADVYSWFTEGFDTADLKDAKALLDELGAVT